MLCQDIEGGFLPSYEQYQSFMRIFPWTYLSFQQTKPDTSKSTPGKAGRKKSPQPERNSKSVKASTSKKGTRGLDKQRPSSNTSINGEDDKLALPPPITLSVKVDLIRWKTAADSLKQP